MFKKFTTPFALVSLIGVLCLTACVSNPEKRLDKKEMAENEVRSTEDLHQQADQLIGSSPGLTIEQRENLTVLKTHVESELNEIRDESVRLRSVLLSDVLASKKYNDLEVSLIKKRMQKLEERRINMLFDAVAKANDILGHMTDEKAQEMRRMFWLAQPLRD